MHGNQETDVLKIGTDKYKVTAVLPGRGPGKGLGVYAEKLDAQGVGTGGCFIIKEDKFSTCLAESLMTLPNNGKDDFSTSVIQASLGILRIKGSSTPILLTVQPKFVAQEGQEVMGLDQFILGDKRNPNTLLSAESSNQQKIADCISAMSDPVKKQFAKAIYLSQLNGDESLHIGQFMVTVGKDSKISEIVRVDFGALGRWAGKREKEKDFKLFNTSQAYQKSWFSQFGNDYVSYLVEDPIVQTELVRLWINTNKDGFIKEAEDRFDTQVGVMERFAEGNTELHRKTLSDFLHEVLNKGMNALPEEVDYKAFKEQVKTQFKDTATARCEQMVEKARSERIRVVIAENLRETIAKALIINLFGASTDLDELISQLPAISTYAQLQTYIEKIETENEKAPNQHCRALLKILKPLMAELNPRSYDSASQYREQMAELKTQEVPAVNGEIMTPFEESASASATATSTSEPSTPSGRTSPGGTSPGGTSPRK